MLYLQSSKPADDTQEQKDSTEIEALLSQKENVNFYPYREMLGNIFYEKVGIVRENDQLHEALNEVNTIQTTQTRDGYFRQKPRQITKTSSTF